VQRVILAISFSVATATVPLPALAAQQQGASSTAPAAPVEDQTTKAKRLYGEGKTAYRLGNFEESVEKFEGAYAASPRPTILFNIGLAYERLYTTSNDVAHLRKSKVLLQNFLLETQKDTALGDPSEVEKQILAVDAKIEEHEQREAERQAGLDEEREKARKAQEEAAAAKARLDEVENEPVGTDPGKPDRRSGGALIGLGVAAGLAGGLGGWLFSMRSQEFHDGLVESINEYNAIGCQDPADNEHCAALDEQQEKFERNGEKADKLALGVGIGGGVVGLALVGTGIGLFVRGKKRTKKWQGNSDLSIAPTRRGFVISGRF
jgi:tetratricopeptide (TPR) repeat protein